jgi:hypothetical protein
MVDDRRVNSRHIPQEYTANAMDMMVQLSRVHITLSQMADQKASILMGATFVIFTITVGQATKGSATLPLLLLGGGAFFAAVLAVLSILPATRIYRGPLNLLFFGSFSQLGEEEYIDQLCARLQSDDLIFETMARDTYQNGVVLERKKYRLLGYAYRVFLVGLTASFVAFLVQHL